MFTRTKLATAVGLAAAVGFPAAVQAQQTSGNEQVLEEVFVTGSRIARTTFDTPAPVTVLNAEDINAVGATNVGEFLARMPQTVAEVNSSNNVFSNTASGLQITALRNLGSERTLVLVNGKRFVSGLSPGAGYAVDLNAIPTALIQRIEILTGGTSAVYGSDAVAGVINIITRNDFEGVEFEMQASTPEEGDRNRQSANLSVGGNFDRGNAWLSLGYDNDDGFQGGERSFQDTDIAYYDAEAIEAFGLPYEPRWEWLGSSFPPAGNFGGYLGDGRDFRSGLGDRDNSDRFNRAAFRDLASPVERKFFASGATFALSDQMTVNLEANYSQVEVETSFEPFPLDLNDNIWDIDRGGTGGLDIATSPLLDGNALRGKLLADGYTNLNELGLNRTARRLVEFGARGSDIDRRTARVAGNFIVDMDNGWTWDTYFTWGQTDTDQQTNSGINRERAALALDVIYDENGDMVCRSEAARLQGCAPFDIFGEGTVSPEAVDYLGVAQSLDSVVEQTVIGTTLSGDTGWELGAGPIGFAAGFEYREEKGSEYPDAAQQAGITTSNRILATDGSYDVTEAFAEVRVPFHKLLTLDGAVRYGDYSTVDDITSWKVGFESSPLDSVRFRGTISSSVRAPNVADLYAGAGETFETFTDSCDGIDNSSTGNIAENCRSVAAIQERIDETGAFVLTQVEKQSTGGFESGNPDVKEETADSWTLGVVWTPEVFENFSLALDWYDIEIDDAITIVDRGTVVQRCYQVDPSVFDPACDGRTIRDPAAGALVQVNSGTSNEEKIETAGMDIELSYYFDLNQVYDQAKGQFSVGVLYSYLDQYDVIGIADGSVDDDAGEIEYPDHRLNLSLSYMFSDFTFSWRTSFISQSVDSNTPEDFNENSGVVGPLDDSANTCAARFYHDVQGNWAFAGSMEVYAGVNNLLDQDPCILGQITNYGSVGTNTSSIYDITGREYYAGLRFRF
jgi:outer membrane receptor protein involved in Fe transport